ncbi:hypothetical protein PHLCEN_2v7069 [Hermanssonia centrifuga]|uniref:Uncharacterized protein n=1 Tax=Hermanssonia centrifuga TaxID=98765 RepID=A0A2R6NXL7_9APHY|nr:hypothetical protein PHLCEN_2v7069 [Hermanssonia centrifuga]
MSRVRQTNKSEGYERDSGMVSDAYLTDNEESEEKMTEDSEEMMEESEKIAEDREEDSQEDSEMEEDNDVEIAEDDDVDKFHWVEEELAEVVEMWTQGSPIPKQVVLPADDGTTVTENVARHLAAIPRCDRGQEDHREDSDEENSDVEVKDLDVGPEVVEVWTRQNSIREEIVLPRY